MAKDFSVFVIDSTSSTMDLARELSEKRDPTDDGIFAVVAHKQTHGRGRNGSTWMQATPNSALTMALSGEKALHEANGLADALAEARDVLPMTIVIPASRVRIPLPWLSQAVGCAIYDAIKETLRFIQSARPDLPFRTDDDVRPLFLKWPNDLLSREPDGSFRKVCGVLCESTLRGPKLGHFSIGIGLNFFAAPELETATSIWNTVLKTETQSSAARRKLRIFEANIESRQILIRRYAENLQKEIEEYLCVPRTIGQLRSLVMERSISVGTHLSVNKGEAYGAFLGLTEDAELRLEGVDKPILCGDVAIEPQAAEEIEKERNEKAEPEASAPTPPSGPFYRRVTDYDVTALLTKRAQSKAAEATQQVAQETRKVERIFLGLDLGNTRLHWGLRIENEFKEHGDVEYALFEETREHDLRRKLQPLLTQLVNFKSSKLEILYISVSEKKTTQGTLAHIVRFLSRMLPAMTVSQQEVTAAHLLRQAGLSGQYQGESLGVDRAVRFYYAKQQAENYAVPVAVFSAGTALTCEAVSPSGQIIESLISPGFQMSLNALHEFTAKLPQLEWNEGAVEGEDWGTERSMQRGVAFAKFGAVLEVLRLHNIRRLFVSGGNGEDLVCFVKKALAELDSTLHIEFLPALETETLTLLGAASTGTETHTPPAKAPTPEPNSDKSDEHNLSPSTASPTTEHHDEIMASMKRSRSKKCIGKIPPNRDDFRRIGARLERDGIGERLDRFLARKFKFHARETWRERILSGEVCIERGASHLQTESVTEVRLETIKHTYQLQLHDQIWLFHPKEHEPDSIESCDVIFDDGDTVVFAKPGNLVIHAVGQYSRNTFLNVARKMGYADAAPVHRIDRETSGILVCARSTSMRSAISDAFRFGEMKKMYFAVCRKSRSLPKLFRINQPIGDAVDSKIRLKLWIGGPNAQEAETWCALLSENDEFALYACLPQTGRTNQIRIHLASVGAWIVGDKMYHPDEEVFLRFYEHGLNPEILDDVLFPRHLLHNAVIQGPTHLNSDLGRRPIVCPFTYDMLAFAPLADLLARASLPLEKDSQSEKIREVFEVLSKTDFQQAPLIQP